MNDFWVNKIYKSFVSPDILLDFTFFISFFDIFFIPSNSENYSIYFSVWKTNGIFLLFLLLKISLQMNKTLN